MYGQPILILVVSTDNMEQIDNLLIWKNKVDLTITDKIYDLVKRDIKFQEDQFRGWDTKGLMTYVIKKNKDPKVEAINLSFWNILKNQLDLLHKNLLKTIPQGESPPTDMTGQHPAWTKIMNHYLVSSTEIHIQRMDVGSRIDWHMDYGHARGEEQKTMAFILYLNDDYEGGEIEFDLQQFKLKPSQGDFLFFPPFWTHTHRVNTITKGCRYIITGWRSCN